MTQISAQDDFDLFVWEGRSDIGLRAQRCLSAFDVNVVRVDPSAMMPLPREPGHRAVALVSVTVMGGSGFSGYEWLTSQAIPIIWVAAEERGHDPRFYPPAYSHTLPLSFTCAELRSMAFRLAGVAEAAAAGKTPARQASPLIAVSDVMKALLVEAEMYADCGVNVLIHGETGVGKERIARLLHDRSARAGGPFVAVNCGAVPEGLFEAHFFGHAKGAFTGAAGMHKGYFEQADGGTLFLDEIGDLPLYQQVKLLRVLEQSTITRLGSTTEIAVDFRLVSATNRDLREAVSLEQFRADLYFRLAVIELEVPSLEERGAEEKAAIFHALLTRDLPAEAQDVPEWLMTRIAAMYFSGNVRELANLAERVGIVWRLSGQWHKEKIERVLDRAGGVRLPSARSAPAQEAAIARELLSQSDQQERSRIEEVLQQHGWRRQDTAAALGISRKVLWEKMRKLGITDPVEIT